MWQTKGKKKYRRRLFSINLWVACHSICSRLLFYVTVCIPDVWFSDCSLWRLCGIIKALYPWNFLSLTSSSEGNGFYFPFWIDGSPPLNVFNSFHTGRVCNVEQVPTRALYQPIHFQNSMSGFNFASTFFQFARVSSRNWRSNCKT